MKEYKTSQWPINAGRVDTEHFDRYLNDMQQAGWQLLSASVMPIRVGDGHVLCVFVKEATEIRA